MNDFYSYIENKIEEDNIEADQCVTDRMRSVCDGLASVYQFNVVRGIAVTHDENKITLHIFGCAFDIADKIDTFIKVLDHIDGFYIYNDREDEMFSLSFEFELK